MGKYMDSTLTWTPLHHTFISCYGVLLSSVKKKRCENFPLPTSKLKQATLWELLASCTFAFTFSSWNRLVVLCHWIRSQSLRTKTHLQFGSALAGGRENKLPQLNAARKHPKQTNLHDITGTDWLIDYCWFGKKPFYQFPFQPFKSLWHVFLLRVNNCETCQSSRVFLLRGAQRLPRLKKTCSGCMTNTGCLHFWICETYWKMMKEGITDNRVNWIECNSCPSKQPSCQVFGAAWRLVDARLKSHVASQFSKEDDSWTF